jgi:4-hydroxy-tetrahydrodipicolinate synthase
MSAAGRVKLARALEKLMTVPVAGKSAQPESAVRGKSRLLGLVR